MLGLTKTDPVHDAEQRVAALEIALRDADAERVAATEALGQAVAADDASATEAARARLRRADELAQEAEAGLGVARRRVDAVRDAVATEQRDAASQRGRSLARDRHRVAERVDGLLAALAAATKDYATLTNDLGLALREAGSPRAALANRAAQNMVAALWAACPDVARLVDARRVSAAHWQPLADSARADLADEEGGS